MVSHLRLVGLLCVALNGVKGAAAKTLTPSMDTDKGLVDNQRKELREKEARISTLEKISTLLQSLKSREANITKMGKQAKSMRDDVAAQDAEVHKASCPTDCGGPDYCTCTCAGQTCPGQCSATVQQTCIYGCDGGLTSYCAWAGEG